MARTRRRKRHTQQADAAAAPGGAGGGVPRSFVLKRGRLAALVDELADDVRKVRHARLARAEAALNAALPCSCQVMEPHTAKNLKERKQNKLKDFIHVAGPLGTRAVLLRVARCSRAARSRRP